MVRRTNYLTRDDLTINELRILEYSLQGLTNREIGEKMFLASPTIKFHKGNLFRKLRVTNTIQAIVVGIQKGLIDCPCGKVINHEVVIDGCCYERSE